ncbi:MAG: DUF448 domain-containing protein [Candidatus Adiutrix sp.]|nr:DUF448 domain-containing protein [Candidatus Adiutrix sp.]
MKPADNRRLPERSCLGCRCRKKQTDLCRLALIDGPDGPKLVRDSRRRLGGRGAWLCRDSAGCLDMFLKKRAWRRAFKIEEDPDLTDLELLAVDIKSGRKNSQPLLK